MPQDLIQPYLNKPLQNGWNPFLENDAEIQIDFGIHLLAAGETHTFPSRSDEMAVLLMSGKGELTTSRGTAAIQRSSLIEENPFTVHIPHDEAVTVKAESASEFAVVRTQNPDSFPVAYYYPDNVENEQRGKGILNDACHRIVRAIFDHRNAPPQARLVLGEVINFPGRWSSYPPHHHTQPELYYYRFEPDWGYGHGELGDEVLKLRHHDLLRITGERDHAQTSAPGFHMYYLWTIRHLPGDPYLGFEYTPPFDTLIPKP
ncbi:MAG: 5-deoxy-glucuronate isomerase [Candidatus Omnitrophota bacterium]|jgi:5-deoxy-glucuronate isomerase|nr:MAG: 5-deoxy-glucuronate isomerase [Candidatus Omnitrophota bacterium]